MTPMTPMNPMTPMTHGSCGFFDSYDSHDSHDSYCPDCSYCSSGFYDSYFYLSSTFLLFQAYRANYEALLAQLGGCAGADTYTRREPNDTLKRRR
jgi:hypothetical protein